MQYDYAKINSSEFCQLINALSLLVNKRIYMLKYFSLFKVIAIQKPFRLFIIVEEIRVI